jgi:DNA-directed RNA polymerase subunit H (RpoH/RPB5)
MNTSEKLFAIEVSEIDKNFRILNNILLMLSRRMYFIQNKDGTEEKVSLLNVKKNKIEELSDDGVYEFQCENKKKFYVKLMSQKVSSINKVAGIMDFLASHKQDYKLFVFKEVTKKARTQLVQHSYTEVFIENELMADTIDYDYQPEFEHLTKKEKEDVIKSYNVKDTQIPKMYSSDPVAKYFNLKNNDVIRITRPSEVSGKEIGYRIIVPAPKVKV